MMSSMQGVAPHPVSHKFEQSDATENFSFQTLADVTKAILHHAFWLAEQKQCLSSKEYKKLLVSQGWQGEEKRYLKIAATFGKFSPQDFAQVEPRTIYQLAERSNKYQKVIDRLLDVSIINQETVRSLIKKQRTPRRETAEKPSIWRRLKNGGRYCQVPPIHEDGEKTGTTLQKMMDEEGLTAQQIVAEAIALRQAYKEGKLVLVTDVNSGAE
ncbi:MULTISPECIES: hypothetical protein [unclassified Anabaena]|uniref:hypothetical protein n=1 Tax=unclassified Anabaena TaxID=2619674 RepID=UPI000832F3F8|nr:MULTISPECIES: hypothetical protein [unclassified Anabaena]